LVLLLVGSKPLPVDGKGSLGVVLFRDDNFMAPVLKKDVPIHKIFMEMVCGSDSDHHCDVLLAHLPNDVGSSPQISSFVPRAGHAWMLFFVHDRISLSALQAVHM
jgi:hypothetical protein